MSLLTMALLATYQVRELSTSAVELWALRALRGEVITRSTTYHSLLTTYYSLWQSARRPLRSSAAQAAHFSACLSVFLHHLLWLSYLL